jgi:hypothetical protein
MHPDGCPRTSGGKTVTGRKATGSGAAAAALLAARHGPAISARRVALTDGPKGPGQEADEPHAAHSLDAPGIVTGRPRPQEGLAERSGVEPGAAGTRGRWSVSLMVISPVTVLVLYQRGSATPPWPKP